MAVSILEFEKSIQTLAEAFDRLSTRKDEVDYKINRDSCIQRFEFSIEIAWKTAIRQLGTNITAPKPAIREMARAGLITDVDLWFGFLEARNKSSHTYNEDIAKEVLESARSFLMEAQKLIVDLKKI